jgi:endonuclease/exonuclease/phosphatase family protein
MKIAVAALLLLCSTITVQAQTRFKLANWNIRSGDGLRAIVGGTIDSTTQNCTNAAATLNAWGYGLPQAVLRLLTQDRDVIVLGVEEAWACASPPQINGVLGWAYASPEFNGTALLARYGIKGALAVKQIGTVAANGDDAYALGADVYLDSTQTGTVRVYVVHFSGPLDINLQSEAQAYVAWMRTQPFAQSHVLIGDLNAFDPDLVVRPCGATVPSVALPELRTAGYLDAWLMLKPTTDGDTGMWNRNGCGTPNGTLFKRIDYVFTMNTVPTDIALFGLVPVNTDAPSDHAGIVAAFDGAGAQAPAINEVVLWPARDPLVAHGTWTVVADSTAAGGQAVGSPEHSAPKITSAAASPTDYFETTFDADADKAYHVWIRGRAAANCWCADSAYLQFSDTVYGIGTTSALSFSVEELSNEGVHGWGWADDGYGSVNFLGPHVRFTTSGPHTVRVQTREDGLRIDQIVISAVKYLTTAPGTQRDDATILPEVRQ